jgi:antitoxin ParD1/3/4
MKQKTTTMNVSLPVALRAELEKKLKRNAYGTASEYVRDLIRKDLQREALARVDELLLEGLHSGEPIPVTEEWWEQRKAALSKARPRARHG